MSRFRLWFRLAVSTLGLLPAVAPALARQSSTDLTAISLESLLSTEVTSVSRHQEELRKTAAAVYVITQEDIRRSGITDIADLFRMVPGVQVAQIDSNVWGVGARGFNGEYSKELLVMVDGRTVYDPAFSGVYWHLENLVLEDIDRIEVIRGPGATMWGANAVNGVISITMKRTANTQGGLLVADAGSGRPGEGSFRFGGPLGKNDFYRIFGRQTTRSSSLTPSGTAGGDAWNLTTGGFRTDWNPSKSDSLTLEAESYRGVMGSSHNILTSLSPITFGTIGLQNNRGGHALARWSHSFSASNLAVQGYYDISRHDGYDSDDVQTSDLDLQYRFKIGHRNDVMAGFGLRHFDDQFDNSLSVGLTPSRGELSQTSGFVQDQITLTPDRLYLTIGTKLQHDTLAGFNAQPAVALSWLATPRQSLWASVSHAVRTVDRPERNVYSDIAASQAGPLPLVVSVFGSENARSEGLIAYQTGYRYQANRKLWFDMASFYNVYDHLSTAEPGNVFLSNQPVPHLVSPLYFGNAMKGQTYGAEIAGNYKITPAFALKGSYSFIHLALHGYNGPVISEKAEGHTPQQQLYTGATFGLPKSVEVSGNAYFVGPLPTFPVPGYTRLDLNVGWNRLENVAFNLVGQNLLGSHIEFGDVSTPANQVKRSIFGKITWRF